MAFMNDPRVATRPCALHPANEQERRHCDGGEACMLGAWSPLSGRCHVVGICRSCEHQWTEPCVEHQEPA